MKFTLAVLSSLVVVTVIGCSKPTPAEQKKKEEEFAAAIASTLSAAATPSDPAAKAAGGTQALVGNCTDKAAGYCNEYLGLMPTMAADFCKTGGSGVLTKGAAPCARTGLVGTCESRGPDASEIRYTYKADYESFAESATSGKAQCSIVSGVWIPAPVPAAAPSGATAAKGAAPKPKKK